MKKYANFVDFSPKSMRKYANLRSKKYKSMKNIDKSFVCLVFSTQITVDRELSNTKSSI